MPDKEAGKASIEPGLQDSVVGVLSNSGECGLEHALLTTNRVETLHGFGQTNANPFFLQNNSIALPLLLPALTRAFS